MVEPAQPAHRQRPAVVVVVGLDGPPTAHRASRARPADQDPAPNGGPGPLARTAALRVPGPAPCVRQPPRRAPGKGLAPLAHLRGLAALAGPAQAIPGVRPPVERGRREQAPAGGTAPARVVAGVVVRALPGMIRTGRDCPYRGARGPRGGPARIQGAVGDSPSGFESRLRHWTYAMFHVTLRDASRSWSRSRRCAYPCLSMCRRIAPLHRRPSGIRRSRPGEPGVGRRHEIDRRAQVLGDVLEGQAALQPGAHRP